MDQEQEIKRVACDFAEWISMFDNYEDYWMTEISDDPNLDNKHFSTEELFEIYKQII